MPIVVGVGVVGSMAGTGTLRMSAGCVAPATLAFGVGIEVEMWATRGTSVLRIVMRERSSTLAARPRLGSIVVVVARVGRNPGVEMSVPYLELWGRVVVGAEVVGPVEVRIGMGEGRSGMSRRRTWLCRV
jgi:hypothetical protein